MEGGNQDIIRDKVLTMELPEGRESLKLNV